MIKHIRKFWSVVLIVAIWIIFSFPYLFKGMVPFPSTYLATFFPPWSAQYGMPVKNNAMPDVISQIYPWKKLTIDIWKSGSVPLWNPYSFSGTALAGNYQSAVFSPFNVLFFILQFLDAWSILILLQPLLAGLFMYLFVKSLGRSQSAASIAGIAFMFCGFMVTWMAYGTLGYAVLWLPLIFWGIHGYFEKQSRWQPIVISTGIALSFVSGHFQMSLYVLGASVFYLLWQAVSGRKWRQGIVLAGSLCAGIFLAMPQILLSYHVFQNSVRSAGVVRGEIIPWTYLVTLIAPDFFGNPVTRNDWFGHYAEWGGYIGVIPILLSVYVFMRKKNAQTWFFISLSIIALLLALPTPLNDLLYILKVPVLSGSAASRIIVLTSFSLAVLAGLGLDELINTWRVRQWRQIFQYIFGWICFIVILWGLLVLGKLLSVDKLEIAKRNFVLPSALVGLGLSFFVLGLIRKRWLQMVTIAFFVILTSFDLLRFAIKWMPFDPRKYVYPQVKSLTYLQTHAGLNRVFGNIGNEVGSSFAIQLVDGYDAVYQERYGEFINAVSKGFIYPGQRSVVQFDKNGLYKTEALQLLGIRYIYHRLSDGRASWAFPFWEYLEKGSMRQVYSDEVYEIFEYPDAFPRTFLASSYTVASSDKEIIDVLFSRGFNRRDSLVLEKKPDIEPQNGTGSAEISSYTPSEVTIETNAAVPKLLFLSDVYDSGWHATVDRKDVPIYRADYDFRAVAVPAGTHTVQFDYRPAELQWGIILCVVGLIGMVVILSKS